jgi:hypothetical protein
MLQPLLFDEAEQVNKEQGTRDGKKNPPKQAVGHDADKAEKKIAQKRTDDADNDIASQAEAGAFGHEPAEPSGQRTDEEENEKTLKCHGQGMAGRPGVRE